MISTERKKETRADLEECDEMRDILGELSNYHWNMNF